LALEKGHVTKNQHFANPRWRTGTILKITAVAELSTCRKQQLEPIASLFTEILIIKLSFESARSQKNCAVFLKKKKSQTSQRFTL